MKYAVFLFALFLCLHTNGQSSITTSNPNTEKTGLTSEELAYACAEYKKLITTETYLESEKIARNFADKWKRPLIIIIYH